MALEAMVLARAEMQGLHLDQQMDPQLSRFGSLRAQCDRDVSTIA